MRYFYILIFTGAMCSGCLTKAEVTSTDANITPVAFQFTAIETTNNYFNTGQAPVQLVISGFPYFIAILVDDANFADAEWTVYTSSNIMVNLGPTEGWHEVCVGLRGQADATDAAVWRCKRLKLDLTPPLLVVTNPVVSTVSVPLIQLQGYSPEPLININYDLTNAAGLVTNQQVLVSEQFYSTKTREFTTNTFQAYDVRLTNGLNTITLHATDLAGNVTTTNFSFTLDYSSRTNPPPVKITWPQNGTQISGTKFTLRGWVDDPTAKVMTQLVLTNGSSTNMYAFTNTYFGEVGRDGNFWLENLPLQSGTNTFAITVTDAAGNAAVTNVSVVKSALVLTINPVTPDSQLWQPTVNLTGTISDPTYAVWVNGVKGKNNGDGTWSAANVPVNRDGTANFDATAYAPNEKQPDGSFGN